MADTQQERDTSKERPTPHGVKGLFHEVPMWVWLAVGAVAILMYVLMHKSSSAAVANPVTTAPVDPVTGVPTTSGGSAVSSGTPPSFTINMPDNPAQDAMYAQMTTTLAADASLITQLQQELLNLAHTGSGGTPTPPSVQPPNEPPRVAHGQNHGPPPPVPSLSTGKFDPYLPYIGLPNPVTSPGMPTQGTGGDSQQTQVTVGPPNPPPLPPNIVPGDVSISTPPQTVLYSGSLGPSPGNTPPLYSGTLGPIPTPPPEQRNPTSMPAATPS